MAQLREHDAIKGKFDQFRVDPRLLKVEPGFNVRDLDDPAERPGLDELKADIRENGVQVALEIRLAGEDIYITSGHRRHKVVMELIAEGVEIDSVPATAEPKTINDAERAARLITLNSGKPLTPLQKAEVVRRLIGFGWDRQKIAKGFGVAAQTVANWENALSLPEEVREMVRGGEVSASVAVSTVRSEGAPKAVEKLRQARTVARESGKRKITSKSFALAPQARPEPPRNQAKVDSGIAGLLEVIDAGYPVDTAAAAFMARRPDDIARLIEWLTALEVRLREKEDDARYVSLEDPAVATA